MELLLVSALVLVLWSSLALKFNFTAISNYTSLNGKFGVLSDTNDLAVGYPVLIYDTTIGTGVTSVDSNNNSVVGIGTTFLTMFTKFMRRVDFLKMVKLFATFIVIVLFLEFLLQVIGISLKVVFVPLTEESLSVEFITTIIEMELQSE